ncbi:MAG TPA: carboxypeptidase regulatory-like domain-containing protein [Anaeromyxobacter sp.]|nr:carboxypeptidase regulatory-like domain-containing protein [Anaeromyxobacter sp.]
MEPTFLKRTGTLLLAGLFAAACGGNSTTTLTVPGTVSGKVTNASKAAVAGVVVTPNPASVPAATTDSSGNYSLQLPPGNFSLTFTAANYEPATASGVSVSAGATTTVNQQLSASTLVVTVTVPDALKSGGPAGFSTTVSGITASAVLGTTDVTSASTITWAVTDSDGGSAPGGAAPSPATGATTSFQVADFETLRQAANAWLNARYGTTGTDNAFDYIQAPERDQLLSIGPQQLDALAFVVTATVTNGGRTSTGSATIVPATITSGVNELPLGMMAIGNAPSTLTSYSWTLGFLPMTATDATFTDATSQLQGATTKNPYIVPTQEGVYKLTQGTDAPIYFRIATYHGAPSETSTVIDGTSCASCHTGTHALTDKFTAWSGSAHANYNWQNPMAPPESLFEFGLDGGIGPHYSESCIQCHVVGYSKVPTAVNGGFDDRAKAEAWNFPTPAPGNWAALPADLQALGAIECESCHGPLEPTDHSQPEGIPALFALPLAPVASMSAGVCMNCHDEFPFHDIGPLWSASPHAQTDLTAEATVENRGTTAAHCGRCHAGEGFVAYVAQQQQPTAGAWGLIARPAVGTNGIAALTAASLCTPAPPAGQAIDPNCICAQTADYQAAGLPKPTPPACYHDPTYYAYLNGLGLNNATVHSQTCQTCHNPHTTTLRVDDTTGVTAAGFSVSGAGAGALCMVCHNTRNGVVFADSAVTTWSAPHTPSQGDIFAGRNAYFFGKVTPSGFPASTDPTYNTAILNASTDLPNLAVHAKEVPDTCAGCHVWIVPPDVQAQFSPASTNHTFRTTPEVCAQCHGSDLAAQVASQVDGKMTDLGNTVGVLFMNRLNVGDLDAAKYDTLAADGTISDTPTASAVTIAAGSVQSVVLSTVHGSPALIVTLTDGTVFGAAISSTSAPTFKKGGALVFGATGALTPAQKTVASCVYNYLFIQGGGAHGYHNPAYVNGVLDATLAQAATVSAL